MQDMRRMSIGKIVDYIMDWNDREKRKEREEKRPRRRRATQADIDSFFGG